MVDGLSGTAHSYVDFFDMSMEKVDNFMDEASEFMNQA